MIYVDYDETVCPFCGGGCRWPTTGEITANEEIWNRFLEDDNFCSLIEVCDEGGGTVGYTVCCNNTGGK